MKSEKQFSKMNILPTVTIMNKINFNRKARLLKQLRFNDISTEVCNVVQCSVA
jgi:hypothetical protein